MQSQESRNQMSIKIKRERSVAKKKTTHINLKWRLYYSLLFDWRWRRRRLMFELGAAAVYRSSPLIRLSFMPFSLFILLFFLNFFFLDRARSRLPFTSYFVFIYLVLSSLLHVFDDVLCVLFQFYLLGGVAGLSCMHNNNFNFIDIKWSLLFFVCYIWNVIHCQYCGSLYFIFSNHFHVHQLKSIQFSDEWIITMKNHLQDFKCV